ncbi:MAG: MFS transporter [Deltaproteobacteria bacterium]|nr:MFS transporter [Deltaproteobacteria bacterium]
MLHKLIDFFKTGADKPVFSNDHEAIKKIYQRRRWSVFLSVTFGYGFYYVCRLSFSVVKKHLLEDKIFDANQLGQIGTALFLTYAFGKFFNGFLADRLNIKRFISLGLLLSAVVHLILGSMNGFFLFVVLWGLNGWFQSFGAASSVVSLSQWYSPRELGTYYGVWITSHNIGAVVTYLGTAFFVTTWGWRMGFIAPGVICACAAVFFYAFMYDRPQTYGLPQPGVYRNDPLKSPATESVWALQREVIKNPAVWVLGLSSACMYIARYAIESWGIVFMGTQKGYDTMTAATIMSTSQMSGLVGTILSGIISDRFFNSRRNWIALIFGILYALSLAAFLYLPKGHLWLDIGSMVVFGFALGVLLCYLGGLMAVDISSKRAAGAAMGMIGLFSYLATALQDSVSGYLIETGKVIYEGQTTYDFGPVSLVWISAAVLSIVFATLVWNVKPKG